MEHVATDGAGSFMHCSTTPIRRWCMIEASLQPHRYIILHKFAPARTEPSTCSTHKRITFVLAICQR